MTGFGASITAVEVKPRYGDVAQRIESIAHDFLYSISTEHTRIRLEEAVRAEVLVHYNEGGFFLDAIGEPILTFEEAAVVVGMGHHSATVSIIRSLASTVKQMKRLGFNPEEVS